MSKEMVLTGAEICRLMRKERMTMRGIKSQYGILLKRTREVRKFGVRGFAAEEWHKIITGTWP